MISCKSLQGCKPVLLQPGLERALRAEARVIGGIMHKHCKCVTLPRFLAATPEAFSGAVAVESEAGACSKGMSFATAKKEPYCGNISVVSPRRLRHIAPATK